MIPHLDCRGRSCARSPPKTYPTMNKTHFIFHAFALSLCLLGGFLSNRALADTLTLSDGSVLNGQIIRIEGGEIILSTSYAGEITVKQAQVVDIA